MHLSSIFGFLAATGIVTAAPVGLEDRPLGDFRGEIVAAHNFFRNQHGASNLTWNKDVANKAQKWASTCNWGHSGSGENLAYSTGFSSWGGFVNMWGSERTKYDFDNPDFSAETGHFTQVVWKGSRSVGCGWKKCSGGAGKAQGYYVVCQYAPAGNYLGEFAKNVGRQTRGKPADVWRKPEKSVEAEVDVDEQ